MFPTVSAIPDFKLGSDGPGDIDSGGTARLRATAFPACRRCPRFPRGGVPSTPTGRCRPLRPRRCLPPGRTCRKDRGSSPHRSVAVAVCRRCLLDSVEVLGDNNAATPVPPQAGPLGPGACRIRRTDGKGAGGGMGGGMPMGGAGGQGQGAGKSKVMQEQKAIYTEKRQWTEGVIGRRPQKGAAEQDKATRPKYPVATAPGGNDVR